MHCQHKQFKAKFLENQDQFKMFAANNMTYQRRRAQEKKATRRAIARAEVKIILQLGLFKYYFQARRERAEAASELMDQTDINGEDYKNKDEKVEEFFDVCKNYNKGPKKE